MIWYTNGRQRERVRQHAVQPHGRLPRQATGNFGRVSRSRVRPAGPHQDRFVFGTVRPGLSADLLLADGDVARDVRCLANVRAVSIQGQAVLR